MLQENLKKNRIAVSKPGLRKHMNWSKLVDQHNMHPHLDETTDRMYCTSYYQIEQTVNRAKSHSSKFDQMENLRQKVKEFNKETKSMDGMLHFDLLNFDKNINEEMIYNKLQTIFETKNYEAMFEFYKDAMTRRKHL